MGVFDDIEESISNFFIGMNATLIIMVGIETIIG